MDIHVADLLHAAGEQGIANRCCKHDGEEDGVLCGFEAVRHFSYFTAESRKSTSNDTFKIHWPSSVTSLSVTLHKAMRTLCATALIRTKICKFRPLRFASGGCVQRSSALNGALASECTIDRDDLEAAPLPIARFILLQEIF